MGSNPGNYTALKVDHGQNYSMQREFILAAPDGTAGDLFEKDLAEHKGTTYPTWQWESENKLREYFAQYNNVQLAILEDLSGAEKETLPPNWHYVFTHKSLARNNKVLMMIEIYYGPQKPRADHSHMYPKITL